MQQTQAQNPQPISQNNQAVGYILLAIGVAIILGAAFQVLQVLQGQQSPVQIVQLSSVSLDIEKAVSNSIAQNIPGGKTTSAPQEIVKGDEITKLANLGIYVLLMGFFVNVGFRISLLGSALLNRQGIRP